MDSPSITRARHALSFYALRAGHSETALWLGLSYTPLDIPYTLYTLYAYAVYSIKNKHFLVNR
jgi:hypothetical protein